MANLEETIQRYVTKLFEKKMPVQTEVGKVASINEGDRTCSVLIGEDLSYYNVRLNAVVDSYRNHILIVPKLGSYVTVTIMDNDMTQAAVIGYTEIDKVEIVIDGTKVKIDSSGIEMNGGGNGAMVNIQDLKDNLDSLKRYCEGLKTAVSTGLNGVGAGSAANGATGASSFEAQMASCSISIKDMADNKVKY